MERPTPALRTAVFGIHGISPIQRYAFQDQVAQGLLDALERDEPGAWASLAYWPRVEPLAGVPNLRATAFRIHRAGDDHVEPRGLVFDVYEGYWSPYTKGLTNAASLSAWLVKALLSGASATASIPATAAKLRWDFGYVGVLLGLGVLGVVAAFFLGLSGLTSFSHAFGVPVGAPGDWFFANPVAGVLKLPIGAIAELVLEALAAFVAVELAALVRSSRRRERDRTKLRPRGNHGSHLKNAILSSQRWHRGAIAIATVLAAVLIAAAIVIPLALGKPQVLWSSLLLVGAALVLRGARAALDFVVTDVLGDVQVYTTHDTTASDFSVREVVITNVATALLAVLRARDENGEPLYDRVHIAAHSLGSTVAIDVLIRLRQMFFEAAVQPDEWGRLRSVVTFGAALEKTRFFFDVRYPTPTARYDQWENDVYGNLFTDDAGALRRTRPGIYWKNVWYFEDIVANEIVSYRSDVEAGSSTFAWDQSTPAPPGAGHHDGHAICHNVRLASIWPRLDFIHGNYLGDTRFWDNVLPVFREDGPPGAGAGTPPSLT